MPVLFQAITPSPASDSRCCTPGSISCSSSPLASWECEQPPDAPHISRPHAGFGLDMFTPLPRRLLEPVDKPLDFRLFIPTPPSFIGAAQRVPSRTKRRRCAILATLPPKARLDRMWVLILLVVVVVVVVVRRAMLR